MPQNHLFVAFSKPKISDDVWQDWYTTEHISDLVNHKVAENGALYQVVPNPLGAPVPDDKSYVALYQTDSPRCRDSDAYRNDVRVTSELFPDKATAYDVAEFDLRTYAVVDCYDPNELGEGPPKFILWAEIDPLDEDELIKFYQEEHTRLTARHPGWRRQLRLKPGIMEEGAPKDPAPFAVIHEFDHFDALGGPISEEATTTERAKKVFGSAKAMHIRTFKLVGSQGF